MSKNFSYNIFCLYIINATNFIQGENYIPPNQDSRSTYNRGSNTNYHQRVNNYPVPQQAPPMGNQSVVIVNNNINGNGRYKEHPSRRIYHSKKKTTIKSLYELPYVIFNGSRYIILDQRLASILYPKKNILVKNTQSTSHIVGKHYQPYKNIGLGHAVASRNTRSTYKTYDSNLLPRSKVLNLISTILQIKRDGTSGWNTNYYHQQINKLELLGYVDNGSDIFFLLIYELFMIYGILKKKLHNILFLPLGCYALNMLIILNVYPNFSFYQGGFGYFAYWLMAFIPLIASLLIYFLNGKLTTNESIVLYLINIVSFLHFLIYHFYLNQLPGKYNRLISKILSLDIIYYSQGNNTIYSQPNNISQPFIRMTDIDRSVMQNIF